MCIVGWSKYLVILFHFSLGVSAQCDENFNCNFSGCPGTNLTCYCSVQSDVLSWWDNRTLCWSSINSSAAEVFCITIHRNQTTTNRPEFNVTAEVVATNLTGFTSRLVRQSISTELSGSEIRCSHSGSVCSRDQNFTLLVTGCQGNGISVNQ